MSLSVFRERDQKHDGVVASQAAALFPLLVSYSEAAVPCGSASVLGPHYRRVESSPPRTACPLVGSVCAYLVPVARRGEGRGTCSLFLCSACCFCHPWIVIDEIMKKARRGTSIITILVLLLRRCEALDGGGGAARRRSCLGSSRWIMRMDDLGAESVTTTAFLGHVSCDSSW